MDYLRRYNFQNYGSAQRRRGCDCFLPVLREQERRCFDTVFAQQVEGLWFKQMAPLTQGLFDEGMRTSIP